MRRTAALPAPASPPPANSVRAPAVAAAASCTGEGRGPTTRARAPSMRTIEETDASPASRPPMASSDAPRGATAGGSPGAGGGPTRRTRTRAGGVAAGRAAAASFAPGVGLEAAWELEPEPQPARATQPAASRRQRTPVTLPGVYEANPTSPLRPARPCPAGARD